MRTKGTMLSYLQCLKGWAQGSSQPLCDDGNTTSS